MGTLLPSQASFCLEQKVVVALPNPEVLRIVYDTYCLVSL